MKESDNKNLLIIALFGISIQLLFFKYWYPFASYINGDSYAYIASAYLNTDIDIYPIGYSRFIRLFSVLSKSDTLLVIFQFTLLQLSIVSFIFSLFYFYNPSRHTKYFLFIFMIFNPVFLYLANYISSDALFFSLSLIWFNILLWIIHFPSTRLIIAHSIILFLVFTIRYNALFYPVISIIAFFFYKEKLTMKIFGLLLSVIFIAWFIKSNSDKYFQLSGYRQFTPFSGWQIANNAMYAYKFVPNNEVKKTPAKFKDLDKMIRDYFDSTRNNPKHPEENLKASTVYMWTPTAPLRQYMHKTFIIDTAGKMEFKCWATIAPLYKDYGTYIIRTYPLPFIQHYLIPNALKYYAPPLEFLEYYSTNKDYVNPIAQKWFGYKSNKITTIFKDFKINVLNYFPILVGTMNVLFFLGLFSFVYLGGYAKHLLLGHSILLVIFLWIVNFAFSVFASPIALRFQLFPIIVMISFTFLFIDFLIREASTNS